MVEVGGRPLLWHIMKLYSHFGVQDFIICCGYKGYVIKEYFSNYFMHMSDVTFDMGSNRVTYHQNRAEPWRVTLIDTGEGTMTGGRLKRVAGHLEPGEPFFFTYGDGLADINISAQLAFHREHGRQATVAAVKPPGRYGALEANDAGHVERFVEKPRGDGGRINGGFFILEPGTVELIDGDATSWEEKPLRVLAERGELRAFNHDGFWQPMDTLREKTQLEDLWATGKAPWALWT